jgi:hypothetical protein
VPRGVVPFLQAKVAVEKVKPLFVWSSRSVGWFRACGPSTKAFQPRGQPAIKPGELRMGPGLCKWPTLVSVLLTVYCRPALDFPIPASRVISSEQPVSCFAMANGGAQKSKQFVSIKKNVCPKCCSEIEIRLVSSTWAQAN